jgi:hypothetical protein
MVDATRDGSKGSESSSEVKSTCKYCKRAFAKEATLAVHLCEQKRRWQAKDDKWVQLGFQAYLRFFAYTQPTARPKTYEEFSESPYYLAFVKFGRYMINVRCVNTSAFIDWVIKNNKKLDKWATDKNYEEFLKNWIKHENHLDAINRTLESAGEWARQNAAQPNAYFRYAQPSRVIHDLSRGRVSPWCLYCCASGQVFLNTLTESNLALVYDWIDPDYWGNKISTADKITALEVEMIMKELKF